MSYSCKTCGCTVNDNVNYCPNCGALLVINADGNCCGSGSYNSCGNDSAGYNNTANGNDTYTNNTSSGNKNGLKTAAIAGGTALGVTALAGLARNLTHRRRPPYMGGMMGGMIGERPPMGPPPGGGMGGMGGPGRMM